MSNTDDKNIGAPSSLDGLVRPVPSPRIGRPVSPWHWWFAWRPVYTWDRRIVWLCRIQRRLIQRHDFIKEGQDNQWWQYHREHGYLPNAQKHSERAE